MPRLEQLLGESSYSFLNHFFIMNKPNSDLLAAAADGTGLRLRGGYSRRRFLGFAGLLTGAGFVSLQACNNDDDTTPGPTDDGVNLGSGDTGVLNYAYALEQLEAAFYTEVLRNPYTGLTGSEEEAMLRDVRDHEIAHREFLKAALGNSAIPDLQVDFSRVNFSSRDSVLMTAMTFEDLGVQAYNGAGKLLTSADNLLLAGKIVSVEARHAAYIRDLIQPGSFADTSIIEPTTRADYGKSPTEVLAAADPFIVTKINASALPTD